MHESVLITAVGALPSDVLKSVGVHSVAAGVVVNVLTLVGAIAGGVKLVYKAVKSGGAYLRARRGEGRRRLQRRAAFASFVESRIRDLDNKEEWSNHRFAELEAEVESKGVSRRRTLWIRRDRSLRRERSLSRALIESTDQLVLLQGDPGSGKSVALRFVARKMASQARRGKNLEAKIPLYINLKGLQREDRRIDAKLVEDFVLESLQHGSNRDVHRFLDSEFDNGKLEGTWFFLFDSFDEIPEVLSSSNADATVSAYSTAISSFLGMTKCRGIIASRYFRAPPSYGLPTFRIVPLSAKRRRELISKADLGAAETRVLETIPAADAELSALSENPLFLGLLVEYVRDRQDLPHGWYDVFEAFVSKRIETDRSKLRQLFGITADDLRRRSEEIAFTMTATEGLGLDPKRSDLRQAYSAAGFFAFDQLDSAFDALQWSKLARSEEGVVSSTDPRFTFAHRRFQEYFATRIVLREPNRITADALLANARWRETAVTLCQLQPLQSEVIVKRADEMLREAVVTSADSPVYEWQQDSLHVLGLLQSAFAGNPDTLPNNLRKNVLALLRMAVKKGTITDQKWALEVAGTLPPDAMAEMLLMAFRGRSEWLREVAYRQAARLPKIPMNLGVEIRRALVTLTATGQLHAEWPTVKAQVMRLRPMSPFLRAARLLRVAPWIDGAVCLLGFFVAMAVLHPTAKQDSMLLVLILVLHLSYYSVVSMMTSGGFIAGPVRLPSSLGRMLGVLEQLFAALLAEVRAGSAFIPLLLSLKSDRSGALPLSILWMYGVTWSIAATYLSIKRPPKLLLGWVIAPIFLVPIAISMTRKLTIGSAQFAIGALVAMGAFFLLFPLLPSPAQLVFSAFFGLLAAVPLVVRLADEARITFHDWRWLKHWEPHASSTLSATQFIDLLSELRGPNGRIEYIERVRAGKLLPFDPETDLLLRDLLRAIRRSRIRRDSDPVETYRSPILASWTDVDGHEIRDLSNAGLEDQLGQLLEELERDKEIPVA